MRSDKEIAESVASHLKWQAEVDQEQIKIKVENGIVTLEGSLNYPFQREACEVIRCLPDVLRLDNLVTINKADAPVWRHR